MARRSYSRETREAVLAAYPELGPAETSRRFDVPKSTVTVWAHRAGVKSATAERTATATAAMVATFASRRSALADRLLSLAEDASDLLHERLGETNARDLIGAFTRAIHDHQLLAGEVTQRTEVRSVDAIDAEIQALTAEMAE